MRRTIVIAAIVSLVLSLSAFHKAHGAAPDDGQIITQFEQFYPKHLSERNRQKGIKDYKVISFTYDITKTYSLVYPYKGQVISLTYQTAGQKETEFNVEGVFYYHHQRGWVFDPDYIRWLNLKESLAKKP